MKKILYAFLILALALPAVGQSSTPICSEVSLKGKVLTFVLTLPEGTLSGDEILKVTPSVLTRRGELKMEPLLFVSKGQLPYYRRARALQDHETYTRETPYAYTVVEPRKDAVLCYTGAVPEESRELILHYEVLDCCNVRTLKEERIAFSKKADATPPLFITRDHLTPFIAVLPEGEKHREEEVEVRVQFKWDDDVLLRDYKDNRTEIDRIQKLLEPILTQSDLYTIDSGQITGYASPEGSAEHNRQLSERRARSVRDYIASKYPDADLRDLDPVGIGDDWAGLKEALERSSLSGKEELLDLISRTADVSRRKQLLADHPGYRVLYDTLYPPLRRTVIKVKYTVKGLTREEARELFFSRPKDLSVYEAYDLLPDLSKTHSELELHKIIAEAHPTSVPAQVNYSTLLMIQEGRIDEAQSVLERVSDDPRTHNNLGVCHLLKGDLKKAKEYFTTAPKSAITERNLKLVEERM